MYLICVDGSSRLGELGTDTRLGIHSSKPNHHFRIRFKKFYFLFAPERVQNQLKKHVILHYEIQLNNLYFTSL